MRQVTLISTLGSDSNHFEFHQLTEFTYNVCTMNVFKPKCPSTFMFRRKLKDVDADAFNTDLSQIWTTHPDVTVTEFS